MDLETFRYYTEWHDHVNRDRYEAPAEPWRLVRVDPGSVRHWTGALPLNWGLGRVKGGDWDAGENRRPMSETRIFPSVRQRFAEGADWEETDLYAAAEERFSDGDEFRGYGSLDAFREKRLAYVDDLYASIRDEGYRPNAEVGHEMADEDNAFEAAYANHLEPLVVITRDGEVVWTEGYHRFSIAAVLGVESVPVNVLCRHERWQRTRDRAAGLPSEEWEVELGVDPDHPDLADLRS